MLKKEESKGQTRHDLGYQGPPCGGGREHSGSDDGAPPPTATLSHNITDAMTLPETYVTISAIV